MSALSELHKEFEIISDHIKSVLQNIIKYVLYIYTFQYLFLNQYLFLSQFL